MILIDFDRMRTTTDLSENRDHTADLSSNFYSPKFKLGTNCLKSDIYILASMISYIMVC